MKLRIKGNSLRLRLTQSEVETFAREGYVKDEIALPSGGKTSLVYSLHQSEERIRVEASFLNQEIRVWVPSATAQTWVSTEQVGFQNEEEPGASETIFILVEKDFQCLHTRPLEDESDQFPHPEGSY